MQSKNFTMIAILTDFGNTEYLGVMKGVIYSHCANAKIVVLYNGVSPQNIKEGAWILFSTYKYFPRKTIFLCVVDPGVGGNRNPIAVKTKKYCFIGPDNGLMYPAIKNDGIIEARKLSIHRASKTFHGRDVFAKTAACLECGKAFEGLGKRTNIKSILGFYKKGREGEIVRIDKFGNIITNIEHIGKKTYEVFLGKKIKLKLNFFDTYEKGGKKLFLVEGSAKTLEIALKNRNAKNMLSVKVGDRIKIK